MKIFFAVLMCLALTACNDDDKIKEIIPEVIPEVTDLTYLKGSTLQGEGVGASLEADTFIDCHTSLSQFFPKILRQTLVAFGATSGARCNLCTISYNCVPGETVALEYLVSDSASSPSDFETNIASAYDLTMEDVVCPESGVSTTGFESPNGAHLKVTVTGQLGSDTEYLDCFDL